MMPGVHLVMGGSGFLGSHVTRQALAAGHSVRVWTRPTSNDRAFKHLNVEHVTGSLDDDAAMREAMSGVDVVHYCIVDTRAWLRDPGPLYATNVDMLRKVLDAAVAARVPKFVFCSTVGTLAVRPRGRATESMPHNWIDLGGPYIRSRVLAETLALSYYPDHGLPVIALCVSTTYGAPDYGPSPHGKIIDLAVHGRLPAYFRGQQLEVVGVTDAARAFLLAAERGRAGQRYIISDRMMTCRELITIAADSAGVRRPAIGIPMFVIRAVGLVGSALGRLLRRDFTLTRTSVRLAHIMTTLDHSKAERELGWFPQPVEDSIRQAAQFYLNPDSWVTDLSGEQPMRPACKDSQANQGAGAHPTRYHP
jgi:dihydroflavonol-4-reductase